ncbi:hypothetical protein SprV_0301116700 [Sparganum proliferum]
MQFLFDNQLCRRIDGVAMGSPLGPLLADVFMGKLEGFQLSDQIVKLKHYGCYVDDIFAIATAGTDVAVLLNAVNRAHPSIKSTLEMGSAGSFPFLDVLPSRRPDGSIRRSVYRMKAWSGQYANFASFVPLQQKRNLVRCLAQRARKICSADSIEEELRKIQDLLLKNGCPGRFIAKNLAKRLTKLTTLSAEEKTWSFKVPFQGDAAFKYIEVTEALLSWTVFRTDIRAHYSTLVYSINTFPKSCRMRGTEKPAQLLVTYLRTLQSFCVDGLMAYLIVFISTIIAFSGNFCEGALEAVTVEDAYGVKPPTACEKHRVSDLLTLTTVLKRDDSFPTQHQEYEGVIEDWFYNHQLDEPFDVFLCAKHMLKGLPSDCLNETLPQPSIPTNEQVVTQRTEL